MYHEQLLNATEICYTKITDNVSVKFTEYYAYRRAMKDPLIADREQLRRAVLLIRAPFEERVTGARHRIVIMVRADAQRIT